MLFPGLGSRYPGMGAQLHAFEPAFAAERKDGREAAREVVPHRLAGHAHREHKPVAVATRDYSGKRLRASLLAYAALANSVAVFQIAVDERQAIAQ